MTMKDSGQREIFTSGAVRDTTENKTRPDLFSPLAMERIGEWLRLGSIKYGEHNYMKGIPISRCFQSLYRHLLKYQQNDRTEDNMAAIAANAMMILHFLCGHPHKKCYVESTIMLNLPVIYCEKWYLRIFVST